MPAARWGPTPAANRWGGWTGARDSWKCPSASPARKRAARRPPGQRPIRLRPTLRRAAGRLVRRSLRSSDAHRLLRDRCSPWLVAGGWWLVLCLAPRLGRGLPGCWIAGGSAGGDGRIGVSLVRSRKTPSGKVLGISSRTRRCASSGSSFQIVGQGESTSTSEKPRPRTWFSMARRTARPVFITCLLLPSATRSM